MLHCLQDIIPTDNFEGLAESLSGSYSCLKSFLPSIVSQLGPLLAGLPDSVTQGQQRPQSRPLTPSADTMRQGADLVAAVACHMPAADVQVSMPPVTCFTPGDCMP